MHDIMNHLINVSHNHVITNSTHITTTTTNTSNHVNMNINSHNSNNLLHGAVHGVRDQPGPAVLLRELIIYYHSLVYH